MGPCDTIVHSEVAKATAPNLSEGNTTMRCVSPSLIVLVAAVSVQSVSRFEDTASAKTDVPASAPTSAWPALQWKKGTPSPFARCESPTAVINGKLYLFGGFTDDLGASNELDVYDPANNCWTRLKDMPTHVTHLDPAIDGGTVWLAGGFKGKHPGPVTNEVWKYDIASDSWTAGPPLPEPAGGVVW